LEANIEIAQLLFKKNKYQEVINTCNEILATDRYSLAALKLISKSFIRLRQIEDARLYLNKALKIHPDDFEVISELGDIYQAIGDINNAKKYYKKAIDINSYYAPALSNLGSIELTKGNKQVALSLLIKATKSDPQLITSWLNLAKGYFQFRKVDEAVACTRKAIELNPNFINSHFLLALFLIEQKKLQEAEQPLRKAIELKSDFFQAHLKLGAVLNDLGQLEEAEISVNKAIELNPNSFDSHFFLASILIGQNRLQEAEQPLRKTIVLKPDFPQAHLNLGEVLNDLGQQQEAEISIRKAIDLNPDYPQAHFNLGAVLNDLGQQQEAEISIRKAIELNPDYPQAYLNLGAVLNDLGQQQEAVISIRKAIELKPDFAEAHSNLGIILRDLGKSKEAELSTRKAIKITPDLAAAHSNLGNILNDHGKLKEAEISYLKAIKLKPDFANAYYNLGNIFNDLDKLKKAEISYLKAIELNPDFSNAHCNLGNILKELGKYHDAISHYNKAIKLNTKSSYAKLGLIESKGLICDWRNQNLENNWLEKLGIEGSCVNPIGLFCLEDNPLNQLKRAKKFYQETYVKESKPLSNFNNKKIHVGYFSADFRAHPMMYLMGSLFKLHDKSKFQIYLYSFVRKEDNYTKLARESGCIFRDIKELNDIEAVELARSDQLDIAVDRMGYVKGNRMNIFSYRVAPVQIHYMAYCGTLGSDNIDYLIADKVIIPKGYEKFYNEKIIRMPSCYQCNDNTKEICKEPISRKEFNLPEKGFVFTCFSANKKITSREFDIWMRLLKKVKGSVLWLYKSNQYSQNNLIYEAEKRNVDPKRLIFANPLPLAKHLARHSLGDLGLDTFNYNGHTTTSDALWAGLPVLTKIGESFAARVSASILTSLGIPELITSDEIEYEEKALFIARNPDELKRIKTKLASLREISPLYNSELWTKNLEYKFEELVR